MVSPSGALIDKPFFSFLFFNIFHLALYFLHSFDWFLLHTLHRLFSFCISLFISIPIHMGFFDHLQKGGAGAFSLQPKKAQIRKVVQTRPAAPTRSVTQPSETRSPRVPSSTERNRKAQTLKSRSVSSDLEARSAKRLSTPSRIRKRPTPEQRLSSDDDASDSEASSEVHKRARTSASAEPDPERRLRSVKAFSEEGSRPFKMIHAADISSGPKAGKFKPAFGAEGKPKEILLQYPSASQRERYV